MSTECNGTVKVVQKKNYGHPFGLLSVFAKCNEYRTVRAVQKSLPMAPFRFIKCFCPNVASTECSGTVKVCAKKSASGPPCGLSSGRRPGRWRPKSSPSLSHPRHHT